MPVELLRELHGAPCPKADAAVELGQLGRYIKFLESEIV